MAFWLMVFCLACDQSFSNNATKLPMQNHNATQCIFAKGSIMCSHHGGLSKPLETYSPGMRKHIHNILWHPCIPQLP